MAAWLLKTEPHEFSFDDLVQRGVEPWDGVTNNTALMHLRAVQVGDPCVIYHTGGERRAVGLARVARAAYPDPKLDNPKFVCIDVKAAARFANAISLDRLRLDARFTESPLVRIGRLSVVPLTDEQYAALVEMGQPGT